MGSVEKPPIFDICFEQRLMKAIIPIVKSEAHYQRGLDARSANKPKKAINEFRRAVELNPQHAEAYQELGWVTYGTDGDLERAWAYLNAALDIDPSLSDAHMYLGIVLNRLGELHDSETHFRRALSLSDDPTLAHATFAEELTFDQLPALAAKFESLAFDKDARRELELLGGAFAWSDERPSFDSPDGTISITQFFQYLLWYRKSLIEESPVAPFSDYWDEFRRLCIDVSQSEAPKVVRKWTRRGMSGVAFPRGESGIVTATRCQPVIVSAYRKMNGGVSDGMGNSRASIPENGGMNPSLLT
jgi:tetratricopeptide (TPR) repeat protein